LWITSASCDDEIEMVTLMFPKDPWFYRELNTKECAKGKQLPDYQRQYQPATCLSVVIAFEVLTKGEIGSK